MYKPALVVIGYSLDSALLARDVASKGHKVLYLRTGKLGYPLDDLREYISYEDMLKIRAFKIDEDFKKLHNSTYVHIPFDQLKFVNNKNGLISYPLNRSSFESAEEWEQISFCLLKIGEFRENLENASNFVNIYKNFFPKWLYDSLLKFMGVNKWGGFRQSKFTRQGMAKEINLSYLDETTTGTVYRPEKGYGTLCRSLLNHKNIKKDVISIDDLKKFIIKRYKDREIVIMDNRIDYICNYTYGNFDRVKFQPKRIKDPGMEELMDINRGIVFTPTKEYFCASNEEGNIIKIKSTKIDTLNYKEQSNISPTSYNNKLYNEYKKMVKLYSSKHLDLDTRINTTII